MSGKMPSKDLLQDLVARFILNCPPEELQCFERMLFLVEQAHWYYEDVCREKDPALRGFVLKDFCQVIFKEHPSLKPHLASMDEIYANFMAYKFTIPVFGAIIVNPTFDKCLMVKGWGNSSSWGFPKGKVNKDEPDAECAIREVFEEIGYDIGPFLEEAHFVEVFRSEQRTKLYFIRGIDEQTGFATQTRKEISSIAWHWIDDLPDLRKEPAAGKEAGSLKYYMVQQFVGPLRKWIAAQKKAGGKGAPSSAPLEALMSLAHGGTEGKGNLRSRPRNKGRKGPRGHPAPRGVRRGRRRRPGRRQ